jgi:hypothetical protein
MPGIGLCGHRPAEEQSMERNMACDNEEGAKGVCAGDGRGGCVACDDGKGNYKPLDSPERSQASGEVNAPDSTR